MAGGTREVGRGLGLALAGLLGVAVMLCATASDAAPGWRSYINPRFGFRVELPSGWRADPEPANGDGRRVTSPDGQASITVSGSFPMAAEPGQDLALRTKTEAGETVTYRHQSGTMLVLSGTRKSRIFYRKAFLSCRGKVWFDLVIEYPAGQRAAMDPVVVRVAKSLGPSRTGECGG